MEKRGVRERKCALSDSYVHDATTKCTKLKGAVHATIATCCINNDVTQFVLSYFLDFAEIIFRSIGTDRVGQVINLLNEVETALNHVHDHESCTGETNEFHCRKADRPRAYDKNSIVSCDRRSVDCVTPNCKCFYKCILLGGKIRRRVELSCRNDELRTESSVAVYAQRLMVLAAIRLAESA